MVDIGSDSEDETSSSSEIISIYDDSEWKRVSRNKLEEETSSSGLIEALIYFEHWGCYRYDWNVVDDPSEWSTFPEGTKKRTCSFSGNCIIALYECVFIRIRMWLPFSDFE